MDDERFDTLTRQLETPRARRSTVSRGLAALFTLGLAMRQSEATHV